MALDITPSDITLKSGNAISLNIEMPSKKALFIEMRFGGIVLSSGTAFLVANDSESHCALITNRHNVTGRHQETGEPISKTCGIPDTIVIYFHKNPIELGEWKPVVLPLQREDGTSYWIEHPRLGAKADLVALNLTWGDDVYKLPYYLEGSRDRLGLLISPAEPVSVIGYPFGLSSAGKFPIWATGFLAQELSLINADNPTFLIDCRTRQGQSGSAVIAYRPFGHRKMINGVPAMISGGAPVWEFLGIYSGRVNPDSDLGKVWHVSIIAELLSAAAADMAMRLERAASAPSSDEQS